MSFLPEDCSAALREKQRRCEAMARGTTWKPTIQALEEMAAEFGIKAEAAEAMERAATALPPKEDTNGTGSCDQRHEEDQDGNGLHGG